jgi:long-chain acyl-CoA synthetase
MSLNLADCLELSAQARPDKEALVFEEWRLTYSDLAAAAKRVANLLHAKGIQPGDRVAMMIPNILHFPILYYGILYAGATVVPLNVMLRRREIRYQLQDSGARMLFVFQDFAGEAVAAFNEVPSCTELVIVEPGLLPASHAEGESFGALFGEASPEFEMVPTRPEDIAVLLYTSAMHGHPLGALLTHYNLFQNALTIKEYLLKFYPEDVFAAVLPLFHAFGQTTMMNAPLLSQSSIILFPRFEPAKVIETIQRERVSLMAVVPTMLAVMNGFKREERFDLSHMRNVITGGAPLDLALADTFGERFGVSVLQGYGLSETGPVVSFNRTAETNRPGSIGHPAWGVRVGIRRPDGSFAATGETGEIVLRGHSVMAGYWNAPEITAAAMADGWFHTGDLGHLDADGYLFITGLKKDLIIRTGLNVYPRELELVLEAHPAVRAAGVAGVPDALRGEEVRAWVELHDAAEIEETLKALAGYCRQELAVYKVPKRIEAVAALPRLADGRLDKPQLRAWASSA